MKRIEINLNHPPPELQPAMTVLDEMRQTIETALDRLGGTPDLDALVVLVLDPTYAAARGKSAVTFVPRERLAARSDDPDLAEWLASPLLPGHMRVGVSTPTMYVLSQMRVAPIVPSGDLIVFA